MLSLVVQAEVVLTQRETITHPDRIANATTLQVLDDHRHEDPHTHQHDLHGHQQAAIDTLLVQVTRLESRRQHVFPNAGEHEAHRPRTGVKGVSTTGGITVDQEVGTDTIQETQGQVVAVGFRPDEALLPVKVDLDQEGTYKISTRTYQTGGGPTHHLQGHDRGGRPLSVPGVLHHPFGEDHRPLNEGPIRELVLSLRPLTHPVQGVEGHQENCHPITLLEDSNILEHLRLLGILIKNLWMVLSL